MQGKFPYPIEMVKRIGFKLMRSSLWKVTALALLLVFVASCNQKNLSPEETANANEPVVTASATAKVLPSPKVVSNTVTPSPTPTTETTPLATITVTQEITESYTCAAFKWIADVTVPDGTVMKPGEIFLKVWQIENTGTCPWNLDYELAYDHGEQFDGPEQTRAQFYSPDAELTSNLGDAGWLEFVTEVKPGEKVNLPLFLRAPEKAGEYKSVWRLSGPDGIGIDFLWVDIVVEGSETTHTGVWSGKWVHSDPSSLFEEETPLILQQDGEKLQGYFYSMDGRIMLIDGSVSADGRSVKGRWGSVDQGGMKFEWRLTPNKKQFRGVYHLGQFKSGEWCGAREGYNLPLPCGLNP